MGFKLLKIKFCWDQFYIRKLRPRFIHFNYISFHWNTNFMNILQPLLKQNKLAFGRLSKSSVDSPNQPSSWSTNYNSTPNTKHTTQNTEQRGRVERAVTSVEFRLLHFSCFRIIMKFFISITFHSIEIQISWTSFSHCWNQNKLAFGRLANLPVSLGWRDQFAMNSSKTPTGVALFDWARQIEPLKNAPRTWNMAKIVLKCNSILE